MSAAARPANFVERLAAVVSAARRAPFWSERLGDAPVRSLADFERLPVTPVAEYRRQRFGDVVADVDGIEWIPGAWLGQSPERVPVAEGSADAEVRVDLTREALALAMPDGSGDADGRSAVVVTDTERRYFGAEMSAALVRMGVPAHLVTDAATDRLADLLRAFEPDIVVALSPRVDPATLPESVTGLVTVGRRSRPSCADGVRRVDLCVQNELGVLGAAVGRGAYTLNHGRFHFEQSRAGTLVATPYFSWVQPVVRLDTGIKSHGRGVVQ